MDDKKLRIRKIDGYIKENLEQPLSLDTIAREAGYSKYHLCRIFREEMGCTLHRYIQRLRLENAAASLEKTDHPIADIAFAAGYSSQQAFTLAFRKVYSCTPERYRNRRRELTMSAAGRCAA